jgi:hypothetical protein
MRRILGACAFVVALGVMLAVLRPSPVLSDAGITALVNAAYFPRTEDPELHAIAHQRAVEVSTDWSHNGIRPGTWEVLAYNAGFTDPASKAVEQWQGSVTHHAILSNPDLTRIGCAEYVTEGTHYFACVLMAGEPIAVARTPNPTPVGAIPTAGATPEPVLLPDTAIAHDGGRR